jgi:hypothetical protein
MRWAWQRPTGNTGEIRDLECRSCSDLTGYPTYRVHQYKQTWTWFTMVGEWECVVCRDTVKGRGPFGPTADPVPLFHH